MELILLPGPGADGPTSLVRDVLKSPTNRRRQGSFRSTGVTTTYQSALEGVVSQHKRQDDIQIGCGGLALT
jgi:hypothetical protein